VARDVHLVLDPIRLGLSVPQALWQLARRRPDAVFTTGGYVAIPVLIAAKVLGIPALLWEGNVGPGRSVRATARLASAIAVSFAETCRSLPVGIPSFVTGTPIRDVLAIDRVAARDGLHVGPGDRLVVVFGGSQATRTLSDAVDAAMPELARRAIVLHVTGDDDGAGERLRAGLPPGLADRYRPVTFLGDDLLQALAAADLVIGRAGSSTLAEVTAFGLPMVVIPYPHAGAHQRRNAVEMADAGAAHLVENEAFDGAALLSALEIVESPERHVAMSAAARSMGRPGSADAVAALLFALAERRPLPDPGEVARIAAGPMRAAA
jgi:UDP-N-acetylglucosamine--N-acetylmuramyl-(pentapeptide) pyrophosphoryl-undecaprenol N-acetylglucosamine transferase